MTRCVFWSGLLTFLAGAALVTAAPLDPQKPTLEVKVEPYRSLTFWREFAGGRPAKVIALGSGAGYLGLYVFDAHGNCVAWDDEVNARTVDDTAVEWIPARTGTYTVEVKCLGKTGNEVVLSVRQDRGP